MDLSRVIEICKKMTDKDLFLLHGSISSIVELRRKKLEVLNKYALRSGSSVVTVSEGTRLPMGTKGVIEKVARKNARVRISSDNGTYTVWNIPLSMLSKCQDP